MNLQIMLFGGYTPPPVPGRLILNDDGIMRRHIVDTHGTRKRHAEATAKTRAKVSDYIKANPWATRTEIEKGIGMSKSAVCTQLQFFRDMGDIEVRKVRSKAMYRWRESA